MVVLKRVAVALLSLMALTNLSLAQDMTLPPGVKMQDLGTRHDVTLTTHKVIFGSMGDAENGLMLTVDLPEGESAMVGVALDKALTDGQKNIITKYKMAKSITVTCASLHVIGMKGVSSKSHVMGEGKNCVLQSLTTP